MTTTNKKQTSDKHQDKSNVLSLLKAIERIFNLCQDVLNTHTQTALMLSLAIEGEMLRMKLGVMRQRWQYHLPFKEAVKVRFGLWRDKIEKMAASFADMSDTDSEPISEYCPSKHYLLDLYGLLPEVVAAEGYTPYYCETNTKSFLMSQERIRCQLKEQWSTHYRQRFSDHVARQLSESQHIRLDILCDDDGTIRRACYNVLMALADELSKLNELDEPDIQPGQFVRLAERVLGESDHDGIDARKQARRDVFQWKNKTSKKRRTQSLKGEIDTSIKIIEEMNYGEQLKDDIGDDYDIKGHYEGLGQFLRRVRETIKAEDLNDLMYQLFRIRYFREEKEREEAALSEMPSGTSRDVASQAVSSEPQSVQTAQRPRLDFIFEKSITENAEATDLFYTILHRTERYMKGRLTAKEEKEGSVDVKMYKQWKWNHMRVAFEKCGLITEGTAKEHFADFIAKVFPEKKSKSIVRNIQRYNNENAPGFDKIVHEIITEFEDVLDLIDD